MVGGYLCEPGMELLELDCLEMDETMRYLFKGVTSSNEISLVNVKNKMLQCKVDVGENLLRGHGLRQFIGALKQNYFYIWPRGQDRFFISAENLCAPKFPLEEIAAERIHFEQNSGLKDFQWDFSKSDIDEFFLHQQALNFAVSPGFDTLLSLNVVRNIETFEYQIKTVKHVLQHMRGRALLADEVGLGKTIEAGLIMMEYIIRGLVRKVLILTPPSLMEQWREEMHSKFNLDFITDDSPEFGKCENGWAHFDRIITSINRAKRRANSPLVCEPEYDLVIVDEAHHCKNNKTSHGS